MAKYKKVLIVCLIVLVAVVTITNSIVASDVHHLEHCNIEHCQKCVLINHAINFLHSLGYLVIYIILASVILPCVHIVFNFIKSYRESTLVGIKVRLNE